MTTNNSISVKPQARHGLMGIRVLTMLDLLAWVHSGLTSTNIQARDASFRITKAVRIPTIARPTNQ